MTPLRFLKAWVGMGIAGVAVVAFLSLAPDPVDLGQVERIKVGHLLAYAALAWWFGEIFSSRRGRMTAGLLLVLLGVGLEFLQGMTGYRTFAYSDMRDNALGVAAGLAIAWSPLGGGLRRIEGWLATQ